MAEEKRKSDNVILAELKGFRELMTNEFKHVNDHLGKLNGKVAEHEKYISTNKTDIEDVINDRKNILRNLFGIFWKVALVAIGTVFGVNIFK